MKENVSAKRSSPCPFCQTSLEIIETQAGYAIKCPYCHTPIVLETEITEMPFFREADPILDDLPMMAPEPVQAPQAPPPQPTYNQPASNALSVPGGHYACYNCGSTLTPIRREAMSQTGLIVLVVMIMVCLPLFWIGLMMKEVYKICPSCGVRR